MRFSTALEAWAVDHYGSFPTARVSWDFFYFPDTLNVPIIP